MKLALGTSLLALAIGCWAAPQAVHPDQAIAPNAPPQRPPLSLCRSAPSGSTPVYCRVLRRREDEPHTSTTSAMPVHTSTSSDASSSNTTPLSSTQSTLSLQPTPSLIINNFAAEASSSSNSGPSNDQLRTIGIVGGFLAGIAFIAIVGSVFILLRNQRRARSSTASGSTRARSRTHSRAQQPPPFMTQATSDSTFPIIRVPPPRIYTGPRAPTTVSGDMTAATAGHNGDLLQFPMSSGQGSASSRATSFGHHSESGDENTPRRPPHLPSLGLSQARPFLRSVASALSYHASAGHSSPIAQEVEVELDTSVTHGTATSMSGSRTAVTTENTTRSVPIEARSEHSAKPSSQ